MKEQKYKSVILQPSRLTVVQKDEDECVDDRKNSLLKMEKHILLI